MEPKNNHKYLRNNLLILLLVTVLILSAILLGWWLGRSNTKSISPSGDTNQAEDENIFSSGNIKSLVSYELPEGWKEASCPNQAGSVYILPTQASNIDCNEFPASLIKISVDTSNSTDCNQLQNVQNVSKHVCISEYINAKKSLKAETIFNQASPYKKPTTINAYYINTGKSVIKVAYVHDPNDNSYQAGFDQLAKSVQDK